MFKSTEIMSFHFEYLPAYSFTFSHANKVNKSFYPSDEHMDGMLDEDR